MHPCLSWANCTRPRTPLHFRLFLLTYSLPQWIHLKWNALLSENMKHGHILLLVGKAFDPDPSFYCGFQAAAGIYCMCWCFSGVLWSVCVSSVFTVLCSFCCIKRAVLVIKECLSVGTISWHNHFLIFMHFDFIHIWCTGSFFTLFVLYTSHSYLFICNTNDNLTKSVTTAKTTFVTTMDPAATTTASPVASVATVL